MSAALKILSFANRQIDIPACDAVMIKFTAGDCLCHYSPNSELQLPSGAWQYSFFVQEEDLPGSMTFDDFANCNVVEPYFTCEQVTAEAEEEEECPSRLFNCFENLEILETIAGGDYLGVLQFDEACNKFCLKVYPAEDFLPEATPDRDATDWEVFSPNEPLQTAMETYVTHLARPFAIGDFIRVSCAQIGTGPLTVNFTVNGVNLTTTPITLNAVQTLLVPVASLSPAFQNQNPIADGAIILAEVVSAAYDQYGTNWEGLRLAFRGVHTA